MLDICKQIGKGFTNEQGNIPRCGVIPRFSGLEVIALSLTKPTFKPFKKIRKRIETLFSQLDDRFLMIRNCAKDVSGIFTRVMAKITAITALQYLKQ
jgi:hypothetical protein